MNGRMRPPAMRPPVARSKTAAPALSGRVSPADSITSTATSRSRARSPSSQVSGTKRKANDFESDSAAETNINVFVRCRGRNSREVRENSGVVVSTNGIKGSAVELSMGPNAISNKTYQFDKVFSAAADQAMMFEEVVTPVLGEVLSGFNCTIFAYGQTGTGKTYTMSGDSITDMVPIPDGAGIVPRVLHYLFEKLGSAEMESSVKCSFIELYNEELRDLLSNDESAKLKIYDDGVRKGHGATLVQGMEESYIQSASKGIRLLREGSYRRQVAATKCNELSSRSHTVFTITVYLKKTTDAGEDFVSAGKLNLVDLAGSENIQRSGAENKRAAEAGVINKSLLTLGRVINALVDKSSHIPYRESKLTRLLQDSLGGRTKTCIIATVSPAKSNLEETISTLDYAFRAKNIKNKPQINQMVSKKTLLKEFAAEIEKLKGELIVNRQRNGIYLTTENYEQLTAENESRRILSEEQRDIISTMEANLRNKVQELFTLTNSFASIKKDNDGLKATVEDGKTLLQQTETVLSLTQKNLMEESTMRKAHESTEKELQTVGKELQARLESSTSDIDKLHLKLKRKSDLHSCNRDSFKKSRVTICGKIRGVDDALESFKTVQQDTLKHLSGKMQRFVQSELEQVHKFQDQLQSKVDGFSAIQSEVNDQPAKERDELNQVLEEVKLLRDDVKERVGCGLDSLSDTAGRMSAGVVSQIEEFDRQLKSNYAALGHQLKSSFTGLVQQLNEQKLENDRLRSQVIAANSQIRNATAFTKKALEDNIVAERANAAQERADMLVQITAIVNANAEAQQKRSENSLTAMGDDLEKARKAHEEEEISYSESMDMLQARTGKTIVGVMQEAEILNSAVQSDYADASTYTESLKSKSRQVHGDTVQVISAQKSHLGEQLVAMDDIAAQIKTQNNSNFDAHVASLTRLGTNMKEYHADTGHHFEAFLEDIESLKCAVEPDTDALQSTVSNLDEEAREALHGVAEDVNSLAMAEYVPTGDTPEKQSYIYSTALPFTESREKLLAKIQDVKSANKPDSHDGLSREDPAQSPPPKSIVFTDSPTTSHSRPSSRDEPVFHSTGNTLRELDVNVLSGPTDTSPSVHSEPITMKNSINVRAAPSLKRQATTSAIKDREGTKLPKKAARKTITSAYVLEGNENIPAANFSSSVGPGVSRRLRSHMMN